MNARNLKRIFHNCISNQSEEESKSPVLVAYSVSIKAMKVAQINLLVSMIAWHQGVNANLEASPSPSSVGIIAAHNLSIKELNKRIEEINK